jgi:inward rectifier potassium channel
VQAEVMILLKGFDDTFGQAVQTRYSYRYDEIIWGAKFTRAFEVEESGDLLIEVDKVSALEPAELPGMAISA